MCPRKTALCVAVLAVVLTARFEAAESYEVTDGYLRDTTLVLRISFIESLTHR